MLSCSVEVLSHTPMCGAAKAHSWEEIADNNSPLAQPVIVIYERIVLICIKWLLLRLLLLEFDFEKKELFSLLNADFVMLIVFFVQVTRYLKHPTAFLLHIKWCLLFPLCSALTSPLALPSTSL